MHQLDEIIRDEPPLGILADSHDEGPQIIPEEDIDDTLQEPMPAIEEADEVLQTGDFDLLQYQTPADEERQWPILLSLPAEIEARLIEILEKENI